MKHSLLILSILCTLGSLTTRGQSLETDTATLYFRQSRIGVDRSYMDNSATIDSMLAHPGRLRNLRRISVSGAASPEGPVDLNDWLGRKRAEAILELFESHESVPAAMETDFRSTGRDWEGLRRSVEADTDVPRRDEMLALIDSILSGHVSHPLDAVKSLGGGDSYRYMYRRLFPALRRSTLTLEYSRPFDGLVKYVPMPGPSLMLTPPELSFSPLSSPESRRPLCIGVKTNLLYDAALLPNIGVEYYIGRNWSLTAGWMYGWWDRDASHFYWRAYGGTVGARRWWGRKAAEKPLTGHHLGVFAGLVTYDFEFGGTGYMGGLPGRTLWDRCNFICGIEYGYSMPLTRRLNLDFSIGFGYMGGKVIKYVPDGNFYEWQSEHHLNWVGPTKVEVALVWLIGHGNYNAGKGGRK